LRHEIEELRKVDQQQRLSRQSQVPWDAQKQHEARVARMDEIKEELLKLGRGLKYHEQVVQGFRQSRVCEDTIAQRKRIPRIEQLLLLAPWHLLARLPDVGCSPCHFCSARASAE
jgi:hypothetical protein